MVDSQGYVFDPEDERTAAGAKCPQSELRLDGLVAGLAANSVGSAEVLSESYSRRADSFLIEIAATLMAAYRHDLGKIVFSGNERGKMNLPSNGVQR